LRAARAGIGGNALAAERLRLELAGMPIACMPQLGVALPAPLERNQEAALTIGYVGRLLPERAVDMLPRACALPMGSWTLFVAGTGPEQEELSCWHSGWDSPRGLLAGRHQPREVEALWPSLDRIVLPARRRARVERWSTVLVDAMARGVVPVVMEGGILHAVVGETGKTAQDEETLGIALQGLLAYPEERKRLGALARQRVLEHYVDAALAEQTMALWRKVLAAHPPS
jgi:glycosyltransferase involved in cell wall biosynthesis